jgi:hypothetical protein
MDQAPRTRGLDPGAWRQPRESLEEGIALVLALPDQQPPAIKLTPFKPEPAAMGANAELVYA